MFLTILIGLIIVAAIVALVGPYLPFGPLYQYKRYSVLAGIGLFVVGALTLLGSTATIVSTRNVGIVTTFGRPNAELSNGFHFTAPWQNVTEMDGAIQLQKFEGDKAMQVRLGNNSTANANVTIQWRLDPSSAAGLFMDYRTFDGIRENLVDKELQVAMNSEFARFDPLAPGAADGAPLVAISDKVQRAVQAAVGNRVEIQRVFVPLVAYDQQTQDRINALNVEKANTRVAEQAKQTAQAQADANRILAASISNDPNIISNNCVTISLSKGIPVQGCWPFPTGGLTIAQGGK